MVTQLSAVNHWRIKRIRVSVFFYLLIAIGLILSSQPDSSVSAQGSSTRYFGYYWGMNNFASVQGTVNSMFVSNQWSANPTVNNLVSLDAANLTTLANAGIKGIVDVSGVFFNVANNYSLYPDWGDRWNSYWAQMYANGSLPKILAFSPIDEPDLHNVTSATLGSLAHIIKINVDTTPYQIPVMVTLSGSGVLSASNGSYPISTDIKWLGFDEYGCWVSGCVGGVSATSKLQMLRSIMSPRGGSVFVVPQGFYANTPSPTAAQQQALIDVNSQYYQLCISYADCIGMFVFRLSSDAGINQYGVVAMPTLLTYLKNLGKFISYPPTEQLLSLNKTATASASYAGYPPSYAFDSSTATAWNAGGFPTQWVQVDLGSVYNITRVALLVGQSPAGNTIHNVWVAGTNNVFTKVATFSQYTSNGTTLQQIFNAPAFGIRYVKIETTQSPSWVGWPDIKVYGYS